MATLARLSTSGVKGLLAQSGRADTPGLAAAQARDNPVRRMRARTLITLRFLLCAAQLMIILGTAAFLHWVVPLWPCLALVGLSALINLAYALSPAASREARSWEIAAQIALDLVQLSAVLFLIGGIVSPFAVLLIGPATLAGVAQPPRRAAALCLFALLAAGLITIGAARPSWIPPSLTTQYDAFRFARGVALSLVMIVACAFASWSSARSARRDLALSVTETVLAREQRLSALGALSAAVAHELGTPLATISVIATEMMRELPEGTLREDAVLLVEQARRCRDILRQLAVAPERGDSLHERMSLLQVAREIVEPYAKESDVRVEAVVTGPPGVTAPDVWRRPEILHAVSTFVENAHDFAHREILVTARFDVSSVVIEVRDDGPGFAPHILARLGEPYVTSRPGAEGSRTGHMGMGLGVFIAKTLLERSGAVVSFANGKKLGAIVTARWDRDRIEAADINK